MYLFIQVLGLCYYVQAFSHCGKPGPLFIAVHGLLIVVASPVAKHRLSSCGSWAQLLLGMWDLPRPRIEPMSPILVGGLFTTEPPGKPQTILFLFNSNCHFNPNESISQRWRANQAECSVSLHNSIILQQRASRFSAGPV